MQNQLTFLSMWRPGWPGYGSLSSELLNLTDVAQTGAPAEGLDFRDARVNRENILICLRGRSLCGICSRLLSLM